MAYKLLLVPLLFQMILTNCQNEIDEWKKFDHPDNDFTISYPGNWVVEDVANFDFFVNEPLKDTLQVLTNVAIKQTEAFDLPLNLRIELKLYDLNNKDFYEDFELITETKTTVNGVESFQYLAKARIKGIQTMWKQVILVKDNRYIEITATTGVDKYQKYHEVLERIINSLEVN